MNPVKKSWSKYAAGQTGIWENKNKKDSSCWPSSGESTAVG